MIPLNKPLLRIKETYKAHDDKVFDSFCDRYYSKYYKYWLYSSRNGLDIIYKYLYLQKGPLNVGVSPLTCFEALYPIIKNNHNIVFIDIDPDTFNLDESILKNYLYLDVIQPIHLGGNPQRMDLIVKWAKTTDAIIVEDCAQALGSYYLKQHIGSFGDYSVFSFVKNLYSPLGSIFFSKHEFDMDIVKKVPFSINIYKRVKRVLESKCSYRKMNLYNLLYRQLLLIKEDGKDYYCPCNYKLTVNLIKQIQNVFQFLAPLDNRRNNITNKIISEINRDNFIVQKVPEGGDSNRNRLLFKSNKIPALNVIHTLRKKGVGANNLMQNYLREFQKPVNENGTFRKYFHKEELRNYLSIHPYLFSVPNSPGLNDKEINIIISSLNSCK